MIVTEEEKQAQREAVAVRLPMMEASAKRNISRVPPNKASCNAVSHRRFEAILRSPKSTANKIAALWQWADEAARELLPVTACRKRCSHCCYTAVIVPKPEAELIAARTGHKLGKPTVQRGGDPSKRTVPGRGFDDIPFGYDNPCVFLKQGRCSIYAHRPLACRTQFNFDVDELLCKVTCAPEAHPVPYWGGSRAAGRALAEVCGMHEQACDIREWFDAP